MREITTHIPPGEKSNLRIYTDGEISKGGAHNGYLVAIVSGREMGKQIQVRFQNGPIENDTPNGLTMEALLAIVLDRLQSYQKGTMACRENAIVVTKLQECLFWLHSRTLDRKARGVLGEVGK